MTTALSTISRIPAKQAVLNNPRLVAVFLSYLHPFELIGNNGAQSTCKKFHASLELAVKHFVRTAHVVNNFDKTFFGIRWTFTFLQKKNEALTMAALFSTMEQVRRLSLSTSDVSFDIEQWFQAREFVHLTFLSISHGPFRNDLIQAIVKHCPNLQSLRIASMSKVDYSPLCALQQLESVDVGHQLSSVTDKILETLSQVSSLTHVGLADCMHITPAGVATLLKGLPRLCSLDISGRCGIEPIEENQVLIAETISELGKNITHLDMSRGYYISRGIEFIASRCKLLQTLNISDMDQHALSHRKSTRELAQFLQGIKPSLTVIVEEPQSK